MVAYFFVLLEQCELLALPWLGSVNPEVEVISDASGSLHFGVPMIAAWVWGAT